MYSEEYQTQSFSSYCVSDFPRHPLLYWSKSVLTCYSDECHKQSFIVSRFCSVSNFSNHPQVLSLSKTSFFQIYRKTAKDLGFDDCHLFMRAVSFEFAQRKSEMETRPISTVELLQNDGWIDRLVIFDIMKLFFIL